MKRAIIAVLLFVLVSSFGQAATAADNNLSVIQPVMQKMPAAMKVLQDKFTAKDYFGTAEKFMDIAGMFKSLESVIPDNGDKANWDRIHQSMINTAFMGIGACGTKDDKTIAQAIEKLGKYKEEGHKLFIKQSD
ncbi:MAG TPA: hypothetical protein VIS94_07770 [Desulfomonilia bacterium]